MLVLSRQRDQSVMIGNDTEVRIVDVRGDKVRLGFVAPRNVEIYRKEVYDAIRKENESAAQMTPDDLRGVAPMPTAPKMRIVPRSSEDPFLRAAIEEARASLSEGGIPIGAVLVRAGKVIGRGCHRVVQSGDPTAHAEIRCLAAAGRQGTYADTTLYTTLMPCLLCAGAAVQFGIKRIIVGDSTKFAATKKVGSDHPSEFLRMHGIEVVDLRDGECVELTSNFIRDNPKLWNDAK